MTTCRVVCRVAIFIGTFVTFFYVGLLFKLALLRIGTLTEDSSAAKLYETMPFDVRQNVYVFNITNKEEFLSGAKPKFKQLGPYTFNLSLHKDISWAANGSLVYKERRIFTFVPELSAGNLTDIVCTVDPVYAFVQSMFDTLSSSTQKYLKWLLSSRSILFEHTVDEILYSGYPDAIANLAHLFKHDLPVINGRIGYLRALNNSDDGELTVFSGQNNTLKKRNEVYRWRGNKTIPYYGEPCNKLYGTNGELFPAFAPWEPAPQIDVFQPMFCKPWTLYLNESVNSSGVELAKYNTRDDMFSPTGNAKFDRCLQPNGWLKGIFDISNCQHGFPALVSLPHFFRAEECLKDVEGLKPDVKLHDFEIDISPVFGIPVRPALRAQINVRVRRKFSSDSPEIVYPVLWQEIVLAEHESQSLSSMIYYATTVPEFCLSAILWVTAGITFYFLLQDWRSYRRISETSEEDEQPIWSPADDLETDQAAQDNNEVLSSPRSH